MCGLVGIVGGDSDQSSRLDRVERMKAVLIHRGPDGEGSYVDPDGYPVVLGHRRLAIIDPDHGKQPMSTGDFTTTLVFNGAIYNYLELRRELIAKGHPIQSYSDTEVLLHAYREWGEHCIKRLRGMFAFAIWDKKEKKLFCARDRVGIKPFYYHFDGKQLVFGSEIKALLVAGVDVSSDLAGLQDYLTLQFCLDDRTLFKGIQRLEPAHVLIANLGGQKDIEITVRRYWDVQYDIDTEHDESYFVDNLSSLLEDAIQIHLRSDVALGAHLSGGLDSSTIVCMAAKMLEGIQIKTFTGAFSLGPQFDETSYAKRVSEFSGTDYHEVYIPIDGFAGTLEDLVYYLDEPVAGPGSIPQYYVSKLAAKHVKVVLGGQGGDELFIGYARYLVAYLEKCLGGAIFQTANLQKYAVSLESIIPNLPMLQGYVPMLQSFLGEGLFQSQDERYFRLIDRSEGTRNLFDGEVFSSGHSTFKSFQQIFNRAGLNSLINQMTYFDLRGSLPALLHVEDRTSMATSLESRVPLLDHRIVEFMARIPPNVKFASGRVKHLFKEAIKNIVPKEIENRIDKMGFPVPLNIWYRGSGREFVNDVLLSQRARQRGLYNMQEVEKAILNENQYGRVVWGLLCIELWHRCYIDGDYKFRHPCISLKI